MVFFGCTYNQRERAPHMRKYSIFAIGLLIALCVILPSNATDSWAVIMDQEEDGGPPPELPEMPPQAVAVVGAAMTGSAIWVRRFFRR